MQNDSRPKETAFSILKEYTVNGKNGKFSYFKGSLNINGAWVTVMGNVTKKGDFMIKLFKKEAK
jgi:hypothetical protein